MVERVTSYITHSSRETHELGVSLGKILKNKLGQDKQTNIVCFNGDLGAGKTTFIKGVVAGVLGTSGNEVTSPTFTYLNIYKGDGILYHFDLYRLRDSEEFLQFGFDDFFETHGIVCIEWAERISTLLSSLILKRVIRVEMSCLEEDSRQIIVKSEISLTDGE